MTGGTPNDPVPVEVAETGTVVGINELSGGEHQIFVDCDSGRTLILLGDDPFDVL